jgi:deoxyribodipyrimidine photo-lyase
MNVVWFKRDLRCYDHEPLRQALNSSGPVLCLFVFEPRLMQADTFDAIHQRFIVDCLRDLEEGLRALGARLSIRHGDMPDVLGDIEAEYGKITVLRSHEETGEAVTYSRDRAVSSWCKVNSVDWQQTPQFGVIRGPYKRDGWAQRWQQQMSAPLAHVSPRVRSLPPTQANANSLIGLEELPTGRAEIQRGGTHAALSTLDTFLADRGVNYRKGMSSPRTAWTSCSRLSPHLAWGTISMKDVYQRTCDRQQALRADKHRDSRWLQALSSFQGRLRWHCHFIQKFEDEPELEFRNMCRIYDGMREASFLQSHFDAWCAGQTGYPMVDACMRALHRHAWINFRMRAMLVSFASYHLWLDWRPTARYLARHFLDYEPGIHYTQFQMQSGVTGMNAIRIYSPAKQVADHDPKGEFVRRFVPELAAVPDAFIAEPQRMSHDEQVKAGCLIGKDYPAPIVEHVAAVAAAKREVYARRRGAQAKAECQRVYERHGSRRRPRSNNKRIQAANSQ